MMTKKLTDPFFEASFYKYIDPVSRKDCSYEEAEGLFFTCPCGTHSLGIPFAGTNHPQSSTHGWQVVCGTGLSDLTLSPSIAVRGGANHNEECWHGFITNGEVTSCP